MSRWSFEGKDTWRRNVETQLLVANSGERSSSWQSMAFTWQCRFYRHWIRASDVSNIFRLHFALLADFQQLYVQYQNLHWELLCRREQYLSFLGFKNGLKLGGSNVVRQEEVSSFLMNVPNVLCCKQFTAALGHQCPISLEEFLGIAD